MGSKDGCGGWGPRAEGAVWGAGGWAWGLRRASTAAGGAAPWWGWHARRGPALLGKIRVCFLENQHKGDIQGPEQKSDLYLKYIFVISAS